MPARAYDYASGTSDIEIVSPVSFSNIIIYAPTAAVKAYIGSASGATVGAGASLTIREMGSTGNVKIERPNGATAVSVWMW